MFNANIAVTAAPDLSETQMNEDLTAFENAIPFEIKQAMINQVNALNNYQNLINAFSKDASGFPIYPDEYAGAYIKDGILFIQLTDTSAAIQNQYIQWCNDSFLPDIHIYHIPIHKLDK